MFVGVYAAPLVLLIMCPAVMDSVIVMYVVILHLVLFSGPSFADYLFVAAFV